MKANKVVTIEQWGSAMVQVGCEEEERKKKSERKDWI